MPPSNKPSAKATKRLQHQLYLARECPDPVFDLSSCELCEIPSSVFSLCKVLLKQLLFTQWLLVDPQRPKDILLKFVLKEALIVHTNLLTSLKGAGNFADLAELRVLDLHNNRLGSLTDIDLSPLQKLQVLNVENNRLRSLPPSIANLGALQTLNVRGNEITSVPSEIGRLASLRSLDISKNRITILPKQLCHIKTLESIILDSGQMEYPNSSICADGTESIMKFLCSESGVAYTAPSSALLPILSTPIPAVERSRSFSADESALANSLMQYEMLKEQQRQQRLMLEKQLIEDQHQQAELAMRAAANKNHLVQFVAKEHARLDQELMVAQHVKDFERDRLVKTLAEAERQESSLVSRLLEMNEKARKTEELLEQMERERMEVEQWYLVRQEELEVIRRKDVLSSMELMLQQNDALGSLIQNYLNSQEDVTKKTRNLLSETDGNMKHVLNAKQDHRQMMIQQIMKEEKLQKEAFEVLQCQKDARHQRVTSQISLIEQELTELTILEIEQRQLRLDTQMNIWTEKRLQLTELLVQLLDEKDRREKELRARLIEMEEQKLATQTDYWLVQYQRLLDSKPGALIDQETQLEYDVIAILENAQATAYVPQFARHRISIETILQMSHDDLAKIGVHEFGVRQAIIQTSEKFVAKTADSTTKGKSQGTFDRRQHLTRPRIPSAPATVGDENVLSAESTVSVTARGLHSECVICQDAEATVLFLNCGHVCSCLRCSDLVEQCPLDRSSILQKIRLVLPSDETDVDAI